jgi:hypothetical protein
VLVLASIVYHWTRQAAVAGRTTSLKPGLTVAGALTLVFLAGQVVVWLQLDAAGLGVSGNPANAFFYLLTAVHGLHLLGGRGEWQSYLDLPHLKVFTATPPYLLAMKCAAMRLGEEFHDIDDVRYLLKYLNIETTEQALAVVTRYFDESQLVPKTRLALEELLSS